MPHEAIKEMRRMINLMHVYWTNSQEYVQAENIFKIIYDAYKDKTELPSDIVEYHDNRIT